MTAITEEKAIDRRSFESLGHANHGWLDARHHFSFANYYDPARMGWGAIRVWNDDVIAPNAGFPPHPHADMEIITYVRTGAITHQDSMGNVGRTAAGDVQVMSAGSGVRHAEYNLESEPTTLFQIWIEPRSRGGQPSWGQAFPQGRTLGQVRDAGQRLRRGWRYASHPRRRPCAGATLRAGESLEHKVGEGRHAYLVPATGRIEIDGVPFAARDGAALWVAEP